MEVEGGGRTRAAVLCGAAHGGGDVLGLCAAAPAGGGATCVFSASSGGDVRCHAVQWAERGGAPPRCGRRRRRAAWVTA